jgi:DNA-binding transcriptional regulator YhcF (GntR family)
MKASYQEKEYLFNGMIHTLQPGQFITGRNSLAKETGIHRSKVDRILKLFENEHQIEQQMFNKCRIISILNWAKYQVGEQQNEPQVSSKRAASEQQVSTINKDKKDKKEKNSTYSEEFLLFYAAYPKHEAKADAFRAWSQMNGSRPPLETLLSIIEKYKRSDQWQKENGKYIPLPATWLRGRRWEDEFLTKPTKDILGGLVY